MVLDHLDRAGHEVTVVASQRAFPFLAKRFADRPRMRFREIHGLHLNYENNALEVGKSILTNLGQAPVGLARNIATYLDLQKDGERPEVVISDFESWAFFYGLNHYLPVISIDNMQIINRCTHPPAITEDPSFQLAKAAVKVKLPGAFHYLITTFFFPDVRKERTTLIPPILRPEILAAAREPGDHVLVYQTSAANELLLPMLRRLPGRFKVYGMGKEGVDGNVELRPFSEAGFIDDLRTARAVLAGGGFSLMSEAVHLGVPMYAVPIAGQYEQELNARYLESLGYGTWSERFEEDRIVDFLAHLPTRTGYVRETNERTFSAVDRLLETVAGR
jgi:uncharacterized protein (TIGR00661 family)